MGLSGVESRLLPNHDMWFGSSVLLAAEKPAAEKPAVAL
jgi:hypothetical protein